MENARRKLSWVTGSLLAGGLVCALPTLAGQAPPPTSAPQPQGATPPAVGAEGKQPRIVVEKEALDLGKVPEGQDALARFVIRNAGEADLKILRASPS